MLPNFFILGTQKGGTTTLHHLLTQHPEIYLPSQKETKFFARDREWDKGTDFYESEYFSEVSGEPCVGEIDPDYMYTDIVLDRLLQTYPNFNQLKLIFILRNPIDRALSHYLMTYRRGQEPLSFEDALKAEADRIQGDFDEKIHFSYSSRGKYFEQISRFLQHTDANQILILFSDELNKDPLSVLQKIYNFLGVTIDFQPEGVSQHFHAATKPRFPLMRQILDRTGSLKKLFRVIFPFVALRRRLKEKILDWNETGSYKSKPKMQSANRCELRSFLEDDIKQLEQFCDRDLSHWI